MIQLPNDCCCGKMGVSPQSWDKPGASLDVQWRIHYRFYAPSFKSDPKLRYGKLVIIKGMNKFKTLLERWEAARKLITAELSLLKDEAYNPITKTRVIPELTNKDHNLHEPK